MLELDCFLRNMDRAGRPRCYIAWSTRENLALDAAVAECLGLEFLAQPSHVIVFNALYDLGMCADVEVYRVTDVRRFATLDDGMVSLARTRMPDLAAMERMKARFGPEFVMEEGPYCWR